MERTDTLIESGKYNALYVRTWAHDQHHKLYMIVGNGSLIMSRSVWNNSERAAELLAEADRIVSERITAEVTA